MSSKALTQEQIAGLLKPKSKAQPRREYKALGHTALEQPPQEGPLKFFDKEQRCMNSGYYSIDLETNERYYKKTKGRCGSPTNWELDGVPYCSIHAMYRMAERIRELTDGMEPTPVREGE